MHAEQQHILEGIRSIHRCSIAHRDVKPWMLIFPIQPVLAISGLTSVMQRACQTPATQTKYGCMRGMLEDYQCVFSMLVLQKSRAA
jgi:hypothetical protein